MKTPITANFKVKITHGFSEGQYLLKITGNNQLSDFYVDEIISSSKMKVRSIMPSGELNSVAQTVSGNDLKVYINNFIANKLNKELAYNNHAAG
jgi:hypothetical protein